MISAVICTKNEERNIARCLQAVEKVVDEIIIADSHSTDKTESICKSFAKVRFYKTDWMGFSKTKNWANSLVQYDYILSLDADEELSPEIQDEILRQRQSGLRGLYRINRLSNWCGTWVHHSGWFPDRHIRLFPKKNSEWKGDFVHEKLVSSEQGPVTDFKGLVFHYSVVSVPEHIRKIKSYSSLGAERVAKTKSIPALLLAVCLNPFFRFLRHFVFKAGFLDGRAGFMISALSGYSVFLKYSQALKIKLDGNPKLS